MKTKKVQSKVKLIVRFYVAEDIMQKPTLVAC